MYSNVQNQVTIACLLRFSRSVTGSSIFSSAEGWCCSYHDVYNIFLLLFWENKLLNTKTRPNVSWFQNVSLVFGMLPMNKRKQFNLRYHSLWQYPLGSFQTRGTKLERFLSKNQHTWRKFNILTPLGSLGADPYRRYQDFSICFF